MRIATITFYDETLTVVGARQVEIHEGALATIRSGRVPAGAKFFGVEIAKESK